MTGIDQRLRALLDRHDITDCLVRFSRGMDRFDRELVVSAFHPDAVITAGDFTGGPDELYEWARAMHDEGQISTHHYLLNHSCEIDGGTAYCETYYLFAARNRDHTNWLAGGRYLDRLERRHDEWRILSRSNMIEWSGRLPTMPLPFAGSIDNPVAARDRTDPSYRRPQKDEPHAP